MLVIVSDVCSATCNILLLVNRNWTNAPFYKYYLLVVSDCERKAKVNSIITSIFLLFIYLFITNNIFEYVITYEECMYLQTLISMIDGHIKVSHYVNILIWTFIYMYKPCCCYRSIAKGCHVETFFNYHFFTRWEINIECSWAKTFEVGDITKLQLVHKWKYNIWSFFLLTFLSSYFLHLVATIHSWVPKLH